MKYKSSNGIFFYYDPALYTWKFADSTMLFLLGFESVTTYDNAVSDNILISKQVYKSFKNNLSELEHFDIFDNIYLFLSALNQTEDFGNYLISSVNGLKLMLNELTGTTDDRTIPLIFKNDVNKQSINLNNPMYRLPESSRLSKSYFDLQAQKICDIFEDAGFSTDNLVFYRKLRNYFVENYTANSTTTSDASDDIYQKYQRINSTDYDSPIFKSITDYNNIYYNRYTEMCNNAAIFYKLDYAAMYSYALGVLYGCICLEFPAKAVFRLEPKYWYNGTYFNLVNTAWHCFKFAYIQNHWYYNDDSNSDLSNYNFIIENKLKNYSDLNDGIELHQDDRFLCIAYLDNGKAKFEPIIYSYSKSPDTKGAYISLFEYDLDDPNIYKPADELLAQEEPTGIISLNDYIPMYIGPDLVKVYRAYSYTRISGYHESDLINPTTASYLSPVNTSNTAKCNYFIATGNFGWTPFFEDEWRRVHKFAEEVTVKGRKRYIFTYEQIHKNALTLKPMEFSELPTDKVEDDNSENSSTLESDESSSTEQDLNTDNQINNDDIINVNDSTNTDTNTSESNNQQYLYFGSAINKSSGEIIYFYKGLVYCSNDDLSEVTECNNDNYHSYLYGIFDGSLDLNSESIGFPENKSFKYIISDKLYNENFVLLPHIDGFSEQTYYDIDKPIILYTNNTNYYKYDLSTNMLSSYPLYASGYTDTPSSIKLAYFDEITTSEDSTDSIHKCVEVTFRYNTTSKHNLKKYWTSDTGTFNINAKEWYDTLNTNLYFKNKDKLRLYRGEKDLGKFNTYYNSTGSESIISIFNDNKSYFTLLSPNNLGFILVGNFDNNTEYSNSLYNKAGITEYICTFIVKDTNGEYFTTSGTADGCPNVWYDKIHKLYWNGTRNINKWQKIKPSYSNCLGYNSEDNTFFEVIDDPEHRQLTKDTGEIVSYDEFYSNPYVGLIKYQLKAFNITENVFGAESEQNFITCYADDRGIPDDGTPESISNWICCIPGKTTITISDTDATDSNKIKTIWVPRDHLLSDYNYRIVDGKMLLYTGDSGRNWIYDDDNRD